jgi:hypothetical protein
MCYSKANLNCYLCFLLFTIEAKYLLDSVKTGNLSDWAMAIFENEIERGIEL